MRKKRRKVNLWRVFGLLVVIGALIYINLIIVPTIPPPFVPTATPTRAPETFIIDAENFFKEGKLLQSISSYEEAIKSDPGNANNFVALARVQVWAQRYKDGQTNAENALLLNQNNPTAHAVRGWAMMYQDDYLGAEAALKRALALDPNSALAHAYYAELLINVSTTDQAPIGVVEKAIDESRLAVALANELFEAHRARGIVLQNTTNVTQSISEFQEAARINPNIADIHISLGLGFRSTEQYDLAVEAFTRANALNPTDPLPDTLISRTYATIGDYPKAVQYAQTAVEDNPQDAFLWGNFGSMLYRNRQLEEAIIPLRLSIRGGNSPEGLEVKGLPLDYGRVAEYYYIYGLALARLNQCSEAVAISQTLLQVVPDDEIAVFNANEMINICQTNLTGTATPTVNAEEITPTPESTQLE